MAKPDPKSTDVLVWMLHQLARTRNPWGRREVLLQLAEELTLSELSQSERHTVDVVFEIVRTATGALPSEREERAALLLLASESNDSLKTRRYEIGKLLGVAPETFRRHYERSMIEEVAQELRTVTASRNSGARQKEMWPEDEVDPDSVPISHRTRRHAVMAELETVDQAVLLIDNVLIVKSYDANGTSSLLGRTLSLEEETIIRSGSDPLLREPDRAMAVVSGTLALENDPEGDMRTGRRRSQRFSRKK